jgi:hypothetical protein
LVLFSQSLFTAWILLATRKWSISCANGAIIFQKMCVLGCKYTF